MYNDFDNAIWQSLNPNKSNSWIESAYAYFINSNNESLFSSKDVVIWLLPFLNKSLVAQEYTGKEKAMWLLKEL